MSCGVAWVPEDEEGSTVIYPSSGDGVAHFSYPSVASVEDEFTGTVSKLDGGSDSLVGVHVFDRRMNRLIRYTAAGTVLGPDIAYAAMWSASSNVSVLKYEFWFSEE